MGCGSCSTGACSTTTKGCNSNGGCGSGGCNKVNTYDWLGNMQEAGMGEESNVYEIRFKNTHKSFFKNSNRLNLLTGDIVVVESDRGFDVGQISLGGILARLQMKKKRVTEDSDKVKKILRLASDDDIEKLKRARAREQETLVRTRAIVANLKLDMKCSDVEFQGDNTKAIFYYIADSRVDFRELIKLLANEFKIRVEMKQIGLRHEAGLLGGIGPCGRELCCSTWLSDFKSVGTSAARYQNLSLNPMKISGQCGRLKCCLNYELDTYLDALKGIPEVYRIETGMGLATLQKTDIFLRKMWFSYEGDSNWIPVSVEEVNEMVRLNKAGIKPPTLQSLEAREKAEAEKNEMDFVDVVGQAKHREDPRRKKKKKTGQDNRGPRPESPGTGENTGLRPENQNQGPRPENKNRGPRPEGQNRGPRPENKNRGPRPENQNRGPKPENKGPNSENPGAENKPNEQRGPRPENRGPGNQNPNQRPGDRPKHKGPRHKNRGPRREGPPGNEKGPQNPPPPPPSNE